MTTCPPPQPDLATRIERALVLLAYFIELDGDVHVPMFEKFEAELHELKRTQDARSRARRFLMEHSKSASGNAALPGLVSGLGEFSA